MIRHVFERRLLATTARGGDHGFRSRPLCARRGGDCPRVESPRAGVSLLELLIVMTTLSVLLTTSTVTLFRLLRAQSASGGALAASLTTSRLARDLRRDARAAAAVDWEDPVEWKTLAFSDRNGGRVAYSLSTGGVRRTSMPADGPAAVDDYLLPAAQVEWELAEGGRLVVLRIAPSSTSTGATAATAPLPGFLPERLVIEAAVGRSTGTFSQQERE
jgi:hypothetical protein